MIRHSSLLVLALAAAPALAASSSPRYFSTLGDTALFVAHDAVSGRELWRSDGTAEGTYLLADVCPGQCHGNPYGVATAGGLFYFHVTTSDDFFYSRQALWVTDGTAEGTRELVPLTSAGNTTWLPKQGFLYFEGRDNYTGGELWRTNGTPEGTGLVTEITIADLRGGPDEITAFQNRVWFVADDGRGPDLWVSNGTERGTSRFFDPGKGTPIFLRALGKRLVFVVLDGKQTRLWATDGKTTAPVTPAFDGMFAIGSSRHFGGQLVFVAYDPRRGQEIWITDGTARGTRTLTAFARAEPFSSTVFPESPLAGRFLFMANDGSHGMELWITDGTPRGTRLLRDLCPGACSGVLDLLGVHRGLLWFRGASDGRLDEVWVTDGKSTRRVADLSSPLPLGPVGDRMLFAAHDGETGYQIWSSDSTAAGTVRVSDFPPDASWLPETVAVLPDRIIFAATDAEHGAEPWTCDGTETRLIKDINP